MTREECTDLLNLIYTAYPTNRPRDPRGTLEVWSRIFASDDAEKIGEAAVEFIRTDTSGFPPTPGQLLARTADEGLTETEAWSLVIKATRNGIYHSREEFEKLPEDVRRAVGSAENIRSMALDEDISLGVAQSNFMRTYRAVRQQARNDRIMRPIADRLGVKTMTMEGLQDAFRERLPFGTEGNDKR